MSVSPDGRFFHLSRPASARARDVVARAADSSVVLREPNRALLFQEDDLAFSMKGVVWPPPVRNPEPGSLARYALVTSREGRCPFLLDLRTGSRSPFSLQDAFVDFWGTGTFLAATENGLTVTNTHLPEEVLILHRAP